jgi:hypothetical protein
MTDPELSTGEFQALYQRLKRAAYSPGLRPGAQ